MNQMIKNSFSEYLIIGRTTKELKILLLVFLGAVALCSIRYAYKIGRTIIGVLNLIKSAIHGG